MVTSCGAAQKSVIVRSVAIARVLDVELRRSCFAEQLYIRITSRTRLPRTPVQALPASIGFHTVVENCKLRKTSLEM